VTGTSADHRGEEQQVVEAVAELWEDGMTRESVRQWCAAHGIDVLPMAAGVLLTGPARRFREAFGHFAGNRAQAVALPVPDELKDTVRSVTVLPIPQLHNP
jgi:hypothetical protein